MVIKVILETKKGLIEGPKVGSMGNSCVANQFLGSVCLSDLFVDPVVDDLEVIKVILETKKCLQRPKTRVVG